MLAYQTELIYNLFTNKIVEREKERFYMQKKFQVCETGYYSCNEHFGHHDFFQPATLKDFSDKDAKTVNFAKHKIHGLAYQPCYRERPDKQDQADIVNAVSSMAVGNTICFPNGKDNRHDPYGFSSWEICIHFSWKAIYGDNLAIISAYPFSSKMLPPVLEE